MISEETKNKLKESVHNRFNRLYSRLDIKGLEKEIDFQKNNNTFEPSEENKESVIFYRNYWIYYLENKIKEKKESL